MRRRKYLPAIILILVAFFFSYSVMGQNAASQELREAEQTYQAGVSYYDSGEYEKAVETFKRALQLSPNSAESYYHLGMAYGSLGRYREAIEAYKSAIQVKQDYAAAYYNLGHAYGNLKKYENAIRAFRLAIQYEPDKIDAYTALANAYFDSGKEEKAIDTFEAAIRRKPDNPYAYYNLGLLYFPGLSPARAIDAFTQAIIRDPRYAEVYFHRAYAYLLMGRGESAAGDAESYLTLKGWRAEHSLDMAIVAHFGHLQAHDEGAARKALEDAASQGDQSAWPYAIIKYLRQEISARLLFRSASDSAKQVEARAYIGVSLSLRGDSKAALEHLKWVKDHSDSDSLPFALAASEIQRIKANSAISLKR
jgi:tetratricopeptide (TPR) repeat protein